VIGWTDPEGSRPHLGALLLGYYDPDGNLVYAGRAGIGLPGRELERLAASVTSLAAPSCQSNGLRDDLLGPALSPATGKDRPMQQPGLDNRHRDKDGTIAKKHGNTLIQSLRETYGAGFAPDCDPDAQLSDCLEKIDGHSLSQLVRGERIVG